MVFKGKILVSLLLLLMHVMSRLKQFTDKWLFLEMTATVSFRSHQRRMSVAIKKLRVRRASWVA